MQTLVHIKAMEKSGGEIVQTKGLDVPFFWFVWVVTPGNMLPPESDRHLIYVKILTTNEIACTHFRKMIEEGFHTPKTVILLSFFDLGRQHFIGVDNMQTFLQLFEPISGKTVFYERICKPVVVTPIAPHGRLSFHPHVQKNAK